MVSSTARQIRANYAKLHHLCPSPVAQQGTDPPPASRPRIISIELWSESCHRLVTSLCLRVPLPTWLRCCLCLRVPLPSNALPRPATADTQVFKAILLRRLHRDVETGELASAEVGCLGERPHPQKDPRSPMSPAGSPNSRPMPTHIAACGFVQSAAATRV